MIKMKTYVVTTDPGYGEYIYFVKAETEEKAREIISKRLKKWEIIDAVTLLDDVLSSLNDNDSICIGGYEE